MNSDVGAPRIPDIVMAISITSLQATIQWTFLQPFNISLPENYTVVYGNISGMYQIRTPVITANATQNYSIVLDSLDPATEYYYRIESRNNIDTLNTKEMNFRTNDSSEISFAWNLTISIINTLIIESGPVIELQTSSPNDSTLNITWQPPSTPNGNILSYSAVIIDLTNGTIKRNESVHGGESSLVVNDLGKPIDPSLEYTKYKYLRLNFFDSSWSSL